MDVAHATSVIEQQRNNAAVMLGRLGPETIERGTVFVELIETLRGERGLHVSRLQQGLRTGEVQVDLRSLLLLEILKSAVLEAQLGAAEQEGRLRTTRVAGFSDLRDARDL